MKTSSRSSKRKSKHSQKRSKKKTRSSSEKTKKLKQREQLESISDEDLLSNSSVSCSSPMGETRSKKRSRSRDKKRRKDKDKKKRSKRSRLASESSGGEDEDESPRVKKRKRSKKKSRGSESRKKRSVKRRKTDDCEMSDGHEGEFEGEEDKVEVEERKGREKGKERNASKKSRDKSRRARSVSEPNDESDQDYEGKELKEEKVESKERKGGEKGRERSANKRSRDRSRSCSPSKLRSESNSYCSKERDLEKNYPKRLKSVIVVMKTYETNGEQELRDDGHKDEIVCDFDDYPSKSNDSNDGVSGKEVAPYSHEISSVKRSLKDPNSEFVASDVRTSEVPGIQNQVAEGSGGMPLSLVKSGVDDSLIGTRAEVCNDNASSMSGDLEAILRQKALENLLKRKGKLSTKIDDDKNTNHDIEMKRPSSVKAEPVNHHKPNDEEKINSVQKEGPIDSSGPSKDEEGHRLSLRKENARSEEKSKAPDDFVNNRPNLGLFTRTSTRKELLGAKNTWKRQLIPQEPSPKNPNSPREMIVNDSKQQFISQKYSQPNLSAPQESINKDSAKDSASPIVDAKGSTEDVDAVAAPEPPPLGDRSTNDKTNETDEEAQFQQKTMSVMRGGEMVQVSYKVYIPKKAPALARRQLKR